MNALTNAIQKIRITTTQTKHVSIIWSTSLLVLAVLIGIELIQHGQTILGSYFLLEQLGHKLAQANKGGEADHVIHITSHH
jgi:hypothetical protein